MRMGIDIGGTFTDLVLVDDITGDVRIVKFLTDAVGPARGVMAAACQALEERGRPLSEAEILVHGTTLATNMIIERKGSLTALLPTEGHRDSVEMRRERLYDDVLNGYVSLEAAKEDYGVVITRSAPEDELVLMPEDFEIDELANFRLHRSRRPRCREDSWVFA